MGLEHHNTANANRGVSGIDIRRPAEATLIIALLMAAFSAIAVFAPGPITPGRLATFLCLLATTLAFAARSWPKRIAIRLEAGKLRLGERSIPRNEIEGLTLNNTSNGAGVAMNYDIRLNLRSGEVIELQAHTDPAAVVRQAQALVTALDVPVRAGWGLEAQVANSLFRAPASAEPALELKLEAREIQFTAPAFIASALIAASVIGVGAAASLVWFVLAWLRFQPGQESLTLSVLLPTLTAAFVLFVATAVATRGDRISLSASGLRFERRIFGLSFGVRVAGPGELKHAYLLSSDNARPTHLLLLTENWPAAVRCDGASCKPLLAALGLKPAA